MLPWCCSVWHSSSSSKFLHLLVFVVPSQISDERFRLFIIFFFCVCVCVVVVGGGLFRTSICFWATLGSTLQNRRNLRDKENVDDLLRSLRVSSGLLFSPITKGNNQPLFNAADSSMQRNDTHTRSVYSSIHSFNQFQPPTAEFFWFIYWFWTMFLRLWLHRPCSFWFMHRIEIFSKVP